MGSSGDGGGVSWCAGDAEKGRRLEEDPKAWVTGLQRPLPGLTASPL